MWGLGACNLRQAQGERISAAGYLGYGSGNTGGVLSI